MVGKTLDITGKLPTAQLVDSVIGQAIDLKANFIHIEPIEDNIIVRLRINGSLQELSRLPKKRLDSLLDRFKTLSNMNVAERRMPQEGRFVFNHNDKFYILRLSVLPTIDGEKVVVNIVNETKQVPSLYDLGFWGTNLNILQQALTYRSGVILVVGQNDCGKSTTLFSMLSNINDPEQTIATIEDPVEYRIRGAHQTQVNHKANLSFVNGLQAILKHDANILMISELRESKVAKLAFNIAARGKLVVTSIYADDEFDAIELLASAGVNNNLIAHGLNVACSQRLVRRLCSKCREAFEPDKNTLLQLSAILNDNKLIDFKKLHELEIKYQTEKLARVLTPRNPSAKDLSTTETRIKRLWRVSKNGCSECFNTGYNSRISINEVFIKTETIEKLIASYTSKRTMREHAIREGMIPLAIDCLLKALAGEIAITEVFRSLIKPMTYY